MCAGWLRQPSLYPLTSTQTRPVDHLGWHLRSGTPRRCALLPQAPTTGASPELAMSEPWKPLLALCGPAVPGVLLSRRLRTPEDKHRTHPRGPSNRTNSCLSESPDFLSQNAGRTPLSLTQILHFVLTLTVVCRRSRILAVQITHAHGSESPRFVEPRFVFACGATMRGRVASRPGGGLWLHRSAWH